MHLSKAEVRQYILNFLDGSGERWDWDDFISIPLDDPVLERIRARSAELPDIFPPIQKGHYCNEEGLAELRRLADLLE